MSDSGSGGVGEWAPDRVEAGPVGSRFGEVRWFAEIDSTNRYLLDVARRAPVAGLVAVADHQRAGKGRLGRQWEAPAGTGLLVSVLLLPALPVELLHLCSISVALAAADACRRVGGVTPSLKWPNDLVVGNRKLGGILAESVPSTAGGGRAVVVGVGLNVSWPPGEPGAGDAAAAVPEDLRRHATSILRETGAGIDRQALLSELLEGLDRLLDAVEGEEGRREVVEDYRRRCATIGRRVRVELADGAIGGTATEVDAAGRLVVVDGATIHVVDAGDVIHLHGGPERGS